MDTIATATCGHDDCTRRVDQAEHQLCGTTPGRPGGIGCGQWFCDRHLHADVSAVAYTCDTCRDQALRLPKAAAGLVAHADAHGWLTLTQWGVDSGGADFVTVQVGRALAPAERRGFEDRGAYGPHWLYRAVWHSRQARRDGPGPLRLWGVTGESPERPRTHDSSVKRVRELIAANPAPADGAAP